MAIMTKRGNLDNIVTYEHICDTYEDLQNIDPKYATLGSTAIVINQEEGLNAYMATSAGEWVSIAAAGSSGGGSDSGGGITPSGTYNITANGTYNVTRYATAKVNVPNEGIIPSGTTYITANGSYDVTGTAYAEVSIPLTTTTITQNGTYSGPINGGFRSVTVAVAGLEPKLGQVIMPKDTVKTYEPEEMDFGSYKNITVTNSGIDTNSHITVTPNTKTQYIFGNDAIIIPQGTEKESETGVILYYNQPLTTPSCYRLRGEIRTINYNANDEIVTQYDEILDQDYVVPELVLNTSGNTIKLWKHYISISKPAVATITKIKVIVTKPIVFEKIANLTILDEIQLSDGSPNLSRNYQLDTNKINFNENSIYAVLGNTYNAGQANSDAVFFEPFKWNSINGYRKKNYTEIQVLSQDHFIISADYKLSVVDDNIKYYGSVYICELNFTNISNYLDYVTIKPIKTQTKTVTPSLTEQVIVPDTATPITTGDFSQTGMPTYNTPATTGYYIFPMDLSAINQGERYHVTGTIRYGTSGSQYTTEYTVDDDWTADTTKSIPLPTSLYDVSLLWDSTELTAIVPTRNNSTDRSIAFGGSLSFIAKNNSYDGLSQVTVKPIPSEYIIPANTKCIWADSNYSLPLEDISQYKNISINGAPIKDGEVRLWVQAEAQETVSFTISFYGYEGAIATVDWGDNSTNNYAGYNNPDCNITHTYADKGIYIITIHQEGSNGHSTFARYACGQDVNNHNTNLLSIELSAFSYYLIYGWSGGSGYTASEQAFKYCDNLKRVTVHHCSPAYNAGLFSNCSNLETVDIDHILGSSTFNNCPNLKNVYINGNISIDNTFSSCTSIENITVTAITPQSIVADAFPLNNNLKIYVPADSVEAYKTAENWSAYASYITAIQE